MGKIKLKIGNTYEVRDPFECEQGGIPINDQIIDFDPKTGLYKGKDGDLYNESGRFNDPKKTFRALDLVRLIG